MVWVNSGCLYWVQAVGWCNNVRWNVGPMTQNQYNMALERYEWNNMLGIRSKIPMVQLSWNLARNVRLTQESIYKDVKRTLVQSLKKYILICEQLKALKLETKLHPRKRGDPAHYCAHCDHEVFGVLFVREEADAKHVVNCFDCAKDKSADLSGFVCLMEYKKTELFAIYDGFRLQSGSSLSGGGTSSNSGGFTTPATPAVSAHHLASQQSHYNLGSQAHHAYQSQAAQQQIANALASNSLLQMQFSAYQQAQAAAAASSSSSGATGRNFSSSSALA